MLDMAFPDSQTASADLRELVSFSVGQQEYCVAATSVREVRGWAAATLLPDCPPSVRGVINLRGSILPVVDLAARLELPATEPTARHVVIVVWIGAKLVGILVDAVCDILTVAPDQIQATPPLPCETVESLVEGLVTVGDRMIGLLKLDNVLPAQQGDGPC